MNITQELCAIIGKDSVILDAQKDHFALDYTRKFSPKTIAAVFPKSTNEVSEILKFCSKNKIAVVPSGGRTGLSGGAVAANGEIILSLAKMNQIFELSLLDQTLHCQAGVVTKEIQKKALDFDLYFPVDFASVGSSQIGGNIATNAGGIKVIRYGLMRQWVAGLQVVLASGEILDLKNTCIKNNTGYDLKQLFIGSEGTLGVITECIVKLTTPPPELLTSLYALNSLENVVELFKLAKSSLTLSAFEFFTQKALEKVKTYMKLKSPFEKDHSHYVVLESDAKESSNLEKFVEHAFNKGLIVDGLIAQSSTQAQEFWGLRENISESLSQLAVVHKNDISIPISKISQFSFELNKLIEKNYPGIEVIVFGHIGDGNLHINYLKPEKLSKEDFFKQAQHADLKMFELVKSFQGSISAEHGIGLTKKDFLHFTKSENEISYMKQIKKVFDPQNIMNQGKVF
ncbi:MAG: FAD-binding oxidoreductase [Oligoflexia bacterium]|nr:FAD-binding oxidoreductase [Oligoflexia bacterium]